jgi:PleD family two-component response regulator
MLQWTSASERRFTRLGALNDARVLVANPYHGARRAVRAVLEPLGCVVIEAERPAEVLEAARRRRPHVVLLDSAMEREAGSSMVAEIKSDPELFAIAVVLVGAQGDAGDALAAMERGAHDVLSDDAAAFELAARVRAARRGSDMQELLLTRERELERLAYYDELTGLPNRRSVLRQLEALISRGRRHGHALAVLMVDADHFKAVNDRHGHAGGDAALRGLADRLGERLRTEGRGRPLRRRGVRHRAARHRPGRRRGGGRGRAGRGLRAPADDRRALADPDRQRRVGHMGGRRPGAAARPRRRRPLRGQGRRARLRASAR